MALTARRAATFNWFPSLKHPAQFQFFRAMLARLM
jgi:hypothetical protein